MRVIPGPADDSRPALRHRKRHAVSLVYVASDKRLAVSRVRAVYEYAEIVVPGKIHGNIVHSGGKPRENRRIELMHGIIRGQGYRCRDHLHLSRVVIISNGYHGHRGPGRVENTNGAFASTAGT